MSIKKKQILSLICDCIYEKTLNFEFAVIKLFSKIL